MIKSSEISREKIGWMLSQPLEVKVELMHQHLRICQIVVNSILEQEVEELCGPRYRHEKPHDGRYSRYGYNPGSVRMGPEKVPIEVPRVYDKEEERHRSLESYQALGALPAPEDRIMKAVLYGLGTRDYEGVISQLAESFGMSSSTVSRAFIERSRKALETFEKRKLEEEYLALFVDGKALSREQMVIALGITSRGQKVPLGVIQCGSENAASVCGLLEDLVDRGLKFEQGMLVVIDGSKGIRKAIEQVFGPFAVVQRCQFHKRENVVSYLSEEQQEKFRKKIQSAYCLEDYEQARGQLKEIHHELDQINRAAANSMMEGLEETLTLHRLGLHFLFHRSFATTNLIENVNSQLHKYLRKVKRYVNSDQRYRWVASGLIEVEQKMRKVNNFKMLHKMREAVEMEVASRNRKKLKVA